MFAEEKRLISNPLFEALDAAHVSYCVRESARGVPYAGFSWLVDPSHEELHLTAIFEQQVLRITAHDLPEPLNKEDSVLRSGKLSMGALYQSPETGCFELSIAFYVADLAVTATQIFILLAYMDSACNALNQSCESPLPRPHLFAAPDSGGRDIAPCLQALGHKTSVIKRGAKFDLRLNNGLLCQVQLWEALDNWFCARIQYLPEIKIEFDQQQWDLFQRLQRWTSAGRFMLTPSSELMAEVFTPRLGQGNQALIRWTASQAAGMLGVAAEHYQFA